MEQTFTLKNLGRPAITGISLSLAPGGDAGFTLGAPGSTTLDTYATTTVTVTDSVDASSATASFVRLRVTLP